MAYLAVNKDGIEKIFKIVHLEMEMYGLTRLDIHLRIGTHLNQTRVLHCPFIQSSLSRDRRLQGNIIAEYRSTKEAAEETGIDRRQISRAINHVGKHAQGYLWIQKDNYDSNTNYYEIHRKESMRPKPKKIAQYTKDGTFIREWESLTEATRELGIGFSTLSGCLHGRYSQSGGFIWKFI